MKSNNKKFEDKEGSMIPVFIGGFFVFFLIMAILIFGGIYFRSDEEFLLYESIEKPKPENLQQLNEREEEALTTYKVLDEEKGIYRIPIERAIDLLAEEAKK